jgi:hypothetical protein
LRERSELVKKEQYLGARKQFLFSAHRGLVHVFYKLQALDHCVFGECMCTQIRSGEAAGASPDGTALLDLVDDEGD